jgi:hypothetical protein
MSRAKLGGSFVGWWRKDHHSRWSKLIWDESEESAFRRLRDTTPDGGDMLILPRGRDPNNGIEGGDEGD